jgi:triacylglycerol lipase
MVQLVSGTDVANMAKPLDLIDPTLLAGLDLLPTFEIDADNLAEVRLAMTQMASVERQPQTAGVTWFESSTPAQDGHSIAVRVYVPKSPGDAPVGSERHGAVLHVHGGGYVLGSVTMSHGQNLALAADLDALVVSVDYRLAPEHPAPAALEDCYAALCWMVEKADDLSLDPSRIAVRGESAGGGLAAALAQLSRDRGGPRLVHQNLIYPMLDDRTCITAQPEHLGALIWTRKSNAFGWRSFLGTSPGAGIVPDYSAASRMHDLSHLPPAFIAVGALDLFLHEDMDYARRLAEAGVTTELHVYPGAYHGFDVVAEAPVSRRLQGDATAALRAALGNSDSAVTV